MKLTKIDKIFYFERPDGTKFNLAEMVEIVLSATTKSFTEIQADAGLDHPSLYEVRRGRSQSLAAVLALVLVAGYDVELVKKEGN